MSPGAGVLPTGPAAAGTHRRLRDRLVFPVGHSGLMELAFLASNDADHYRPELELFPRQHQE